MPTPTNPAVLGLQKATSIGADPRAEAFRAMDAGRKDAAMPPPNEWLDSLTALGKLAVPVIRRGAAPVAETLGEMAPDFTPVGGEGLYNVAKGATRKAGDSVDAAYQALMARLGGLGR